MKLIGCDRCGAIFPSETRHTKLRIFDTTHDVIEDDGAPAFEHKELCPVCRADLDAFLAAVPPPVQSLEVVTDEPADEPEEIPTHKRQAEKRTCQSCGHTGFRKFQKTPTGWCCWRCIDTQKRQIPPPADDAAEAEADPEPAPETPQPEPPAAAPPMPAGVTARCQDCTRTYTLTGVPLRHAVEMHELKHSHIVDVLDSAGAA